MFVHVGEGQHYFYWISVIFSFMLLGAEISLEVIVVNAEYQSDYDNLNSTAAKAFMDSFELEVCFLILV